MNRVLVTGGSGFLGQPCLQLLDQAGFETVAATSRPTSAGLPTFANVRWVQADLLTPGCAQQLMDEVRPTHLLHLAWFVQPGAFWTAPENVHWLEASLRLIQAFAAAGGRRVVLAGTCAEYDWHAGWCREGVTPLTPRTLYGICKHALWQTTEALAQVGGWSAACGRLFFLYGPREPAEKLVAMLIRRLRAGERVACTSGKQLRDFIHVADAAQALVQLLASDVAGPVNIGTGAPVTVRSIIEHIAQRLQAAYLIDWDAKPLASHEPPLIAADLARLQGEVCFQPQYDLERGLDETLAWYAAQHSPLPLRKGA